MKEKISVIIPTLNEEENIKNCINGLVNQKEKPFEIVVVDNGSKDKTRTVVNQMKRKLKREGIILKLFYYPHGNQTNAREFGIKNARGTIIGSLDADAIPNEEWISKINECFKDKNLLGIGGRSKYRNRGRFVNFFYVMNYYIRLLVNLYCIGGGNSAFRKKAFFSVNGYNGLKELRIKARIKYAKDDYFLSKKIEQIGKLKFCPNLKVTLLQRGDRRNQNSKGRTKSSTIEMLKRAFFEIVYDYKIIIYFNKRFKKIKN